MLCLLFLTAPHTFAEDYNTVLDRLGRLQALANSYVETEDSSADPIVLTLSYTRTGDYNTQMWQLTAGVRDAAFENYVNTNDSDLQSLQGMSTVTLPGGQNIDFGHLLASMNLVYNGIPIAGSWGGDCMQLAKAYYGQASDEAGYADVMRATFAKDDDGSVSVYGDQDLRADIDSINVGAELTKDTDIATALRDYYQNLSANVVDYARAKQFIILNFGTVDTSADNFGDVIYETMLEDSGMQLLLYMNGMWTTSGWTVNNEYAPALHGAADLLAEWLANAVNNEKIKSETNDRLVAMGGEALAEALAALGDSDAAAEAFFMQAGNLAARYGVRLAIEANPPMYTNYLNGTAEAFSLVKRLDNPGLAVNLDLSTMLAHVSAYTILEGLRLQAADRLMGAPLGEVESRPIGAMKSTIVDRIEDIEPPLAHMIPELSSNILLPLVVVIAMFSIDWRMGLALLVTIPLALIPMAFGMRSYNKNYAAYMEANAHVNSVIVEYVEGIQVVKAFSQGERSYQKFAQAVSSFKAFTMDWYRCTWASMNLCLSILPTTLLGTLPMGIYLYQTGVLDPAQVTLCLMMALGIVAPLMSATAFINSMKSMQFALKDTRELLNLPQLSQVKQDAPLDDCNIQLKDVSFSYGGSDGKEVLRHLNLTIPQGKFTALVGPSGGGKSTIARLAARFWDVTGGSITLGGRDIR